MSLQRREFITTRRGQPFPAGHLGCVGLLGNISYRLKPELLFDPATHRFKGDHEANAMPRDK